MKATRGPSRRRSANAPCRFDQSMAVWWKVWDRFWRHGGLDYV